MKKKGAKPLNWNPPTPEDIKSIASEIQDCLNFSGKQIRFPRGNGSLSLLAQKIGVHKVTVYSWSKGKNKCNWAQWVCMNSCLEEARMLKKVAKK